ncbi:Trk system potassium transporter TrkA [Thiotrichales bacterium 19S9-12]|nr:Trk system potassium transporter TrkA [Thiotrichales bacterium 19S9-11]MCF6811354.1 Trk system potassium transporter TrkA [Thiotrichales bacterium 19S9-12]
MKIIILGAGQVGTSLSKNLQQEHDISLVDINMDKLQHLQNKFDIKTVCGSGSHPHILDEAGAVDADMLIAVTNNDEVNIVACQVAYSLYKTPMKIARLRNKNFGRYPQLFDNDHIPIDLIINPADIVTQRMIRLVEHPGSFQVLDFASSQIQMVEAAIHISSSLNGMTVREFRQDLPLNVDARIVSIFRSGAIIDFDADTILRSFDTVFFVCQSNQTQNILSLFQPHQSKIKRIFVAGGGNIGMYFAKQLEDNYSTKLIERDAKRCYKAAEYLNSTIVLSGDAADAELLQTENIEDTDLFCAVTNDDEANIMSAMLAKRLGAKSTIALVNHMSYAELIDDGQSIDRALSPQRITIGVILTHLRKGDMVSVYSILGGSCEAIEVIVHGNKETSDIIGKTIDKLALPPSVRCGAIYRENEVIIAHDDVEIQENDHLIVFVADTKVIPVLEKYFQVSPSFV